MCGLIAPEIFEAARRLRAGQLRGQTIERRYAADDPHVLPFIEAVADGDEARALGMLSLLLANNPRLLVHPYVVDQLRYLFTVWSSADPDITDRALRARIKLVKAWAKGMTLGWKVSITKPSVSRRGQAPQYFPHLDDRDGWLLTVDAARERHDASEFVRAYEHLRERLTCRLRWRSLRERYRQGRAASRLDAAEEIGRVFEAFKTGEGISQPPLDQQTLLKIASAGLTERARGNPSDAVARELFSRLPWYTPQGAAPMLTPSGIKSTLETLRRKGIGKTQPSR